MKDTSLSKFITVAKYLELENDRDRDKIAKFIQERFMERYITPLKGDHGQKHGFCILAIDCLMIEALESFWNGWPDTKYRSREAFKSFFKRCYNDKTDLGLFFEIVDDFYENVRCGILHQAETRNGWHILRKGPIFDPETKTVNATEFHKLLEKALMKYSEELKKSDWEDEIWRKFREKMATVIENCKQN